MPTFLTEFLDPEQGVTLTGPYIVAKTFEEAEVVAEMLIITPDGGRCTVIGELGEQIPFDMDVTALRMLQQQVKREVDAIVKSPHPGPNAAALLDEVTEWSKLWKDEP